MSTMKDARGVDIIEGASCVYGAPVGRSIAMAEGVIDGFTPSGRVWVKVVRRSYGGGSAERVHVGADRLVIVGQLPASPLMTQAEEQAEQRRKSIARYRERIAALEAGEARQGWEREDALTLYRAWLSELEAL
ncbi:hypothetical protein [Streptomyces niveus]|uniref:hypothetical protein n=1 Tax=Streptomyces niveus TaxID=193462 RepID=UPI0038673583